MNNLWYFVQNLFRQKEKELFFRKNIYVENWSRFVPIAGSVDLVTMTVPARCFMRLVSFGNYSGTHGAWGTIYWEFFVDGSLIYPYNRIMDPIGYSGARQRIQDVNISGGHTLVIRANNPTAAICGMGIELEWELFSTEEA